MTKDIHRFIKKLADYINRFIVGSEGSHVIECVEDDIMANRGHAIPVKCAIDNGGENEVALCFYAEELMAEFPDSSAAAVAQIVAERVEAYYESAKKTIAIQKEMVGKTIRDISPEDLYLSAAVNSDKNGLEDGFLMKKHEGLGITSAIKARFDHPDNKDQILLFPIRADKDHPATEEDWKRAETNSLKAAHMSGYTMTAKDGEPPICGEIKDDKQFYDYFYLLTPDIWKPMIEQAQASRIYIFPHMAYAAKFVVENPLTSRPGPHAKMRESFMRSAVAEMPANDVFVLDCKTMEISKFDMKEVNE